MVPTRARTSKLASRCYRPGMVARMSQRSNGMRTGVMFLTAVTAVLLATASAQAQSGEDLAAGRRLFLQKGNCQACHGWAGDGRKVDSQMPDGPNLRET